MNLEIGKTYLTQEGKTVKIVKWDKVDETDKLNYLGDNGIFYPVNGVPFVANSSTLVSGSLGKFNIVKEI